MIIQILGKSPAPLPEAKGRAAFGMIIEEYMQYWGKLLGVIVAIWSGAGFWGVVLGLIIGHMIDTARSNKRSRGFFTDQQTRQTLFFRTTFQVMGHLTKSKGRVTEADIQIASLFMDRLQLHGEARTAAQQAFREGNRASSCCVRRCSSSAASVLAASI